MCIYVFRVNRNTMNLSKRLLYVFVYGTLKRSEPNHCWLNRSENGFAKFLGTGSTIEKFPLVIGTRYNIPFLLDKRGIGNHVQGEVYEIDDNMLGNLDILEDYPTFYDREIQMIHMEEK